MCVRLPRIMPQSARLMRGRKPLFFWGNKMSKNVKIAGYGIRIQERTGARIHSIWNTKEQADRAVYFIGIKDAKIIPLYEENHDE